MTVRATDLEEEVIVREDSHLRVTQEYAQVVNRNATDPSLYVTQALAHVVNNRGSESVMYATQIFATVLITRTPDFGWLDMFIDEEFPHDISYNSIGAIRFETETTRVDSGYDQRNQRWDQPLMEYDVAYGVRTMEDLHDLKQFFYAMRGRLYSFKYFDRFDFNSQFVTAIEGRTIPSTTSLDQALGTGDALVKAFQLQKLYKTKYSGASLYRPIYKPKDGTVKVALAGVEVTNWTCGYTTGSITFTTPATVTATMTMSLVSGSTWKIAAPSGSFAVGNFAVGRKIVSQGWANAVNNSIEADVLTITANGASNEYLHVTLPSGFGLAEAAKPSVTISVHPAPATGVAVTAGFEFFVPVRFDVDRLPVSLEEYGVGGASDVKLVEVRKEAE